MAKGAGVRQVQASEDSPASSHFFLLAKPNTITTAVAKAFAGVITLF